MKGAIITGVLTVGVFFGGLGTWSMLAPLDSAVVGTGALAVHGSRKTVQHREGGIVAALLVQEGGVVEQGQVLVRLDDTQARAIYDVHRSQLLGDEALSARDLAELADASAIDFPNDLKPDDPVAAAVMNRERIVFRNHVDLLARQLDVVDQRIVQARSQEAGAREQFASMGRQLTLAMQEQQAVGELEKVGLAPKNRMLELERGVELLRGQMGQLSSDVARFGSEAVELEAEKLRLRQAAQSDATHELRDAQLRINDVLPRLAADRDLLGAAGDPSADRRRGGEPGDLHQGRRDRAGQADHGHRAARRDDRGRGGDPAGGCGTSACRPGRRRSWRPGSACATPRRSMAR